MVITWNTYTFQEIMELHKLTITYTVYTQLWMKFWPFSGNSEEQDMENLFTCFSVLDKNILKRKKNCFFSYHHHQYTSNSAPLLKHVCQYSHDQFFNLNVETYNAFWQVYQHMTFVCQYVYCLRSSTDEYTGTTDMKSESTYKTFLFHFELPIFFHQGCTASFQNHIYIFWACIITWKAKNFLPN